MLSLDKCIQQTANPSAYDLGQIYTIVVIAVDAYEQYRWPRLSYDTM